MRNHMKPAATTTHQVDIGKNAMVPRMFPWLFLTAHDHRWPSYDPRWSWADSTDMASFEVLRLGIYPLVNVYVTMENHHLFMGKLTISMAMFNSYFDITRGYLVELVSKTSGVGWDPNVAFGFVCVVTPWHRRQLLARLQSGQIQNLEAQKSLGLSGWTVTAGHGQETVAHGDMKPSR